jgi:hypothetical protein
MILPTTTPPTVGGVMVGTLEIVTVSAVLIGVYVSSLRRVEARVPNAEFSYRTTPGVGD